MRIAPIVFCVATMATALVAFGGAHGPASHVAKMLFPVVLILFLGSLAAPHMHRRH